jgi:hypothetical protein
VRVSGAREWMDNYGICLEGTSEHGNESSDSIKGGEFLD